jgi:hypothetical protein
MFCSGQAYIEQIILKSLIRSQSSTNFNKRTTNQTLGRYFILSFSLRLNNLKNIV